MLLTAVVLFSLAAILGITLLSYVLTNKNTPKGLAFTHGPLAAIGIIFLIIYALINSSQPLVSIGLFILAAILGLTLIYRDLTGKSLPKWLAVTHGSIAILAFIFLLIFIFFKNHPNPIV